MGTRNGSISRPPTGPPHWTGLLASQAVAGVGEPIWLWPPYVLTQRLLYQAQQQALGADAQRLEAPVVSPFGGWRHWSPCHPVQAAARMVTGNEWGPPTPPPTASWRSRWMRGLYLALDVWGRGPPVLPDGRMCPEWTPGFAASPWTYLQPEGLWVSVSVYMHTQEGPRPLGGSALLGRHPPPPSPPCSHSSLYGWWW